MRLFKKTRNRKSGKTGTGAGFTYYRTGVRNGTMSNSSRQSPESKQKPTLPLWVRHLPLYLAFGAIFISIIYLSYLANSAVVITEKQSGVDSPFRPKSEYTEGVSEILSESILYRNKLTFSSVAVENKIKARYPEIDQVTVVLPLAGKKPVVGISFVRPIYKVNTSSEQYIIGDNGKVLGSAEDLSNVDTSSLVTLLDKTGREIKKEQLYLTKQDIQNINLIVLEAKTRGETIDNLSLTTSATEYHLKILGEKYYSKLNTLGNMHEQLGALYAVKERLRAEGKQPSEYIDARLAERVYVK